jgi:hypothetical protein
MLELFTAGLCPVDHFLFAYSSTHCFLLQGMWPKSLKFSCLLGTVFREGIHWCPRLFNEANNADGDKGFICLLCYGKPAIDFTVWNKRIRNLKVLWSIPPLIIWEIYNFPQWNIHCFDCWGQLKFMPNTANR